MQMLNSAPLHEVSGRSEKHRSPTANQAAGNFRRIEVITEANPQAAALNGKHWSSISGLAVHHQRHRVLLGKSSQQSPFRIDHGSNVLEIRLSIGAFNGAEDDGAAQLSSQSRWAT